jgi:hypothetical protein
MFPSIAVIRRLTVYFLHPFTVPKGGISGKDSLMYFAKMARHAERYPTKRAGSGK